MLGTGYAQQPDRRRGGWRACARLLAKCFKPGSTTQFTTPRAWRRAAVTGSPKKHISAATWGGSPRFRNAVEPPSGIEADLHIGENEARPHWKLPRSDRRRAPSEKPAPAAAPSTAAITGFGQRRIALIQPCRSLTDTMRSCMPAAIDCLQAADIAAGAESAFRSLQDDHRPDGVVIGRLGEHLARPFETFRGSESCGSWGR